MKQGILSKIRDLGGNVNNVKGQSLKEDLLSISFDTVLYLRPEDTPWASAEDTEPIWGIGEFIDGIMDLLQTDKEAFYAKIADKYFRLTEEGFGQTFWQGHLFMPFKEGTEDFTEWSDWFSEDVDLQEVIAVTNDPKPDFIQIMYSYGWPDGYYICLSDPNPENPTVFGTDHEVFFKEITNEGSLEDFLQKFMTKDEVLEIVRKRVEGVDNQEKTT